MHIKIQRLIIRLFLVLILIGGLIITACGSGKNTSVSQSASVENKEQPITSTATEENNKEDTKETTVEFKNVKLTKALKDNGNANPLITQHFGADPYAMEYDGRLYIYMTADAFEYDAEGKIKENSYGSIKTIYVISTEDMVNFTDHGEIKVAGSDGAATWAHNSWAPAACHKEIDGKEKFFLYFADNGGGIGVLTSDSPTGPFTDPLGHGLITRSTPTCAEVTWLFDPAVLVDDDGSAYIYFGGGVPEGKVSNPGTARVAKLGADMISLEGDPVAIDAPYLFEDSGIHKYKDKYYYTYCSNWQVDDAATKEFGFTNANIVSMESDSPMGPFTFKEVILKNPGSTFGLYGNNHHCVFTFKGEWYITYHARTLERTMGIEKGYRSTHIDAFEMGEDGTIGFIQMSKSGCKQLKYVNPYVNNSAVTAALMAGTEITPADEIALKCGSGNMYLSSLDEGDYIKISGVDFGEKSPKKIIISVANTTVDSEIYITAGKTKNAPIGVIKTKATGSGEFLEYSIDLSENITGVTDIYIIGATGNNMEILQWRFEQ